MRDKILTIALALASAASAQTRSEAVLADGWQFSRDGAEWQSVTVPHDWAISGPFDKKWDLQTVAIVQNNEKVPTEKSGRSGALPWIGEGHYKRTLHIPEGYAKAELVFDGAMAEPTVSVNGQRAGYWAYGYNAFRVDITPYVKPGDNLLEVSLKNVEESSRWYPGGGIYRPVTLVLTGGERIGAWATFARTDTIVSDTAWVDVDTRVEGIGQADKAGVEITLSDRRGYVAAASRCDIAPDGTVRARLDVAKPELWSPESPYLYKLTTRLYKDNRLADELAMDRSTLRRIFQSKMRMTPSDYLAKLRIQHALSLLDQTRLPLAEVADRSGFSDVSYFCRVIRRAVGVSPGSFRAH